MSKFHPIGSKVLVRIETTPRYSGTIYIPEDVAKRQDMSAVTGVVVAMGPLCFLDQKDEYGTIIRGCRVGDRVKFAKFAGFVHVEDDTQYRFMSDLDIMMVEKEDE